jgi:hypothetical protein
MRPPRLIRRVRRRPGVRFGKGFGVPPLHLWGGVVLNPAAGSLCDAAGEMGLSRPRSSSLADPAPRPIRFPVAPTTAPLHQAPPDSTTAPPRAPASPEPPTPTPPASPNGAPPLAGSALDLPTRDPFGADHPSPIDGGSLAASDRPARRTNQRRSLASSSSHPFEFSPNVVPRRA